MNLSEFKRKAQNGDIKLKLVYRFGEEIPEKLSGIRKVISVNTVGIKLSTTDGKSSELRFDFASLADISDSMITLYNAGERELTGEEQLIFDRWEGKRDYKQENIDLLTDGSTAFYSRNKFFTDEGFEYLLGYDRIKGMKYNFNTKKVSDSKIKGEKILQYEII